MKPVRDEIVNNIHSDANYSIYQTDKTHEGRKITLQIERIRFDPIWRFQACIKIELGSG